MLEVKNLQVGFNEVGKIKWVVKNSSFSVSAGEILGIVGESGSGKSMTALAIMGLCPVDAIVQGQLNFQNRKMNFAQRDAWQELRGVEMGMVFQDPTSSLNPLYPVGQTVAEALVFHKKMPLEEAKKETEKLFTSLGILPAAVRARQYPHQLSGGLKQRVMLAAAICCKPKLLIADEPTTALDVTVQAQILNLLTSYAKGENSALLLISHDLGVIAQTADRVLVMCKGVIVEEAPVLELFKKPLHPYTQLLINSLPRLDRAVQLKTEKSEIVINGSACLFAGRCRYCRQICLQVEPKIKAISEKRRVCCHFPLF
ncbi:MAG: ABC transporter ATP-binding protein [Firmicutes bacterium]|nr:ABC transporter ATP-binding protein [Bacillota bacterium]